MSGTAVAYDGRQAIADRFGLDAAGFGKALWHASNCDGDDDMVNVCPGDAELGQGFFKRPAEDLGVALVPYPAAFPAIVELGARRAEMVDKIDGDAVRAKEGCRNLPQSLTGLADKDGSSGIALNQFAF